MTSSGSATYKHNAAGQLVPAGSGAQWNYDSAGHRTDVRSRANWKLDSSVDAWGDVVFSARYNWSEQAGGFAWHDAAGQTIYGDFASLPGANAAYVYDAAGRAAVEAMRDFAAGRLSLRRPVRDAGRGDPGGVRCHDSTGRQRDDGHVAVRVERRRGRAAGPAGHGVRAAVRPDGRPRERDGDHGRGGAIKEEYVYDALGNVTFYVPGQLEVPPASTYGWRYLYGTECFVAALGIYVGADGSSYDPVHGVAVGSGSLDAIRLNAP